MIRPSLSLLSGAQRSALKLAAAAGAAAFALGCYVEPGRAWGGLFVGNFFFVSLSLAAAVFIAVQNLASAGWSVVFRRVPEAMTAYLPVGAALTAVLFLGARFIYPWAAPGAVEILGPKAGFLNIPAVGARAALCWALWLVLIRGMVAVSRREDLDDAERAAKVKAASAVFLVVFGVTFTLCSVDWIMSLEPNWYSTIYPWYVFIGAFEAGLAALAVLAIVLKEKGVLAQLNEHHLHDLGKFLFAFSAFWAYLWFSQYLLIWYSNIPEETTFYLRRLAGRGWSTLFYLNLVVNFALPFALLLQASQKKRPRVLLGAALLLLAGHWLDLYVLVMPSVAGAKALAGPIEVLIFTGLGSAFVLLFERSFFAADAVPEGDPYLDESIHFEGV